MKGQAVEWLDGFASNNDYLLKHKLLTFIYSLGTSLVLMEE